MNLFNEHRLGWVLKCFRTKTDYSHNSAIISINVIIIRFILLWMFGIWEALISSILSSVYWIFMVERMSFCFYTYIHNKRNIKIRFMCWDLIVKFIQAPVNIFLLTKLSFATISCCFFTSFMEISTESFDLHFTLLFMLSARYTI